MGLCGLLELMLYSFVKNLINKMYSLLFRKDVLNKESAYKAVFKINLFFETCFNFIQLR